MGLSGPIHGKKWCVSALETPCAAWAQDRGAAVPLVLLCHLSSLQVRGGLCPWWNEWMQPCLGEAVQAAQGQARWASAPPDHCPWASFSLRLCLRATIRCWQEGNKSGLGNKGKAPFWGCNPTATAGHLQAVGSWCGRCPASLQVILGFGDAALSSAGEFHRSFRVALLYSREKPNSWQRPQCSGAFLSAELRVAKHSESQIPLLLLGAVENGQEGAWRGTHVVHLSSQRQDQVFLWGSFFV